MNRNFSYDPVHRKMYQKKRNFGQNLDFWLFAQAWRATYECIHGNLFFCWAYQCMECKYLSRLSHRKFGLKYILDPTHSDRILVIIIIFLLIHQSEHKMMICGKLWTAISRQLDGANYSYLLIIALLWEKNTDWLKYI